MPHRDSALPARTRRILHLDVDAFLASVEQVLHPELAGRPVVIGGAPTSRNLVMSCSYDVRALGVRPGMSLREARQRCPRAIFRDGDSQGANRLREETTRVLLSFSPRVQVASIDDFFVDLTGAGRLFGAACEVAAEIRARVRAEVGLPLTVGVATSKLMARLAGKLAKPGGVAELLPGYERAFLSGLPVEQLPGVGRSIGAHLERFAIRTVGELALVPRELLFASFGRDGLVLYERARGVDEAQVEPTHTLQEDGSLSERPPRSIRRDATFEPEEGHREVVEGMLAYLCERAAHRLRGHGLCAGSVEVRLRYVDTRSRPAPGGDGLAFTRRAKLPAPTDSTDALWEHAREILRGLPHKRALVKRVGVGLVALSSGGAWQRSLFDADADRAEGDEQRDSKCDRHRRIDAALDELRARMGFGRVVRGASSPIGETHPLQADGYRLRTPSLNQ